MKKWNELPNFWRGRGETIGAAISMILDYYILCSEVKGYHSLEWQIILHLKFAVCVSTQLLPSGTQNIMMVLEVDVWGNEYFQVGSSILFLQADVFCGLPGLHSLMESAPRHVKVNHIVRDPERRTS
jgi:hypothetical protein